MGARSSWDVSSPSRLWWSGHTDGGGHGWNWQGAKWEELARDLGESTELTADGRGRIWWKVHTKQGWSLREYGY